MAETSKEVAGVATRRAREGSFNGFESRKGFCLIVFPLDLACTWHMDLLRDFFPPPMEVLTYRQSA